MSTAEARPAAAGAQEARPALAGWLAAPIRSTAAWTVIFLGLTLALRVYAFAASRTVIYPDTGAYLAIARAPFTNSWWWVGDKPFVVPLAWRLVGATIGSGLLLQLVLSSIAWSVLALAVMHAVRTGWLKPLAVALVLAFSLSHEITEWDRVALSESISLSLLALLVAALILYVERPGRLRLGMVLALWFLWAFARDANAYDLLFAAPVFAFAGVLQRRRRTLHGVAAAGMLAIFALSVASANAGLRWEQPFYNVIGLRVLPDQVADDYFVNSGMPTSGALVGRTGRAAADEQHAFFRDPRLAPFRSWALAHGESTYIRYLLTHPRAAILEPGSQIVDLLSQLGTIRGYARSAWAPFDGTPLQGIPSAWLFPDRDAPGVLLTSALGFAAATALLVGGRRRWLVPALLVATAVPLAMVIYHGDAVEVGRHELVAAAQLRLGLWLLLLFAIDVIAVSRLTGREAGAGVSGPRGLEQPTVAYVVARLNVGGVARVLTLLAAGMKPEFAGIVLTGDPESREGSLVEDVRAAGTVVVQVPGLRRQLSPFDDARALWWLYRFFRRTRPSVVATHTAKGGALGRVAAIAAGVPIRVHTFHGHVLEGYFDPLRTAVFRAIERVLAAFTTRVIAVSPQIAADLRRFGIPGDRITVVRLGFDLDPLSGGSRTALRAELGVPDDVPVAGIVGRLAPIKNHRLFLEACRRVHERLPAVRFVVVGDGELAPELHAEAARLGLGEVVLFTGWRRDLADVYAALDLVVCCSLNEGVPATLIEAGAAGRPVVATDVGGVPDLVQHGVNGSLVPSGDAAALADAMAALLTDRELAERMGQAGAEIAFASYGAQRLVEDTAALYRVLLDAARTGEAETALAER